MTPAFDSFSAFVAMGHHGAYVWSAWGLTLLCVLALIVDARARRRRFIQETAARLRRAAARQEA
ncbi:MAG: hypothetical protein RLY58_2108 [Pseudomonadota bacterium]|jgi:heme exporter protein D